MANLILTENEGEVVKKVIVTNTNTPLLEKLSPPGPRAGFCHPGHHPPCNCDVIFEGESKREKLKKK